MKFEDAMEDLNKRLNGPTPARPRQPSPQAEATALALLAAAVKDTPFKGAGV